jgi:hypothetical protein
MTDAYTASRFDVASNPTTSLFNTSQVDKNLRQLSAVDSMTRMPALPDTVKLDLASLPGATEDSLLDLLLGIDSDMNDEDDEPSSGLILPDSARPSGLEQAQIILAGISSNPPPQQVSGDAVQVWKQRAMQKGYLPEGTEVDSTWSPELNRIRSEMAYDDYNRALRGNRELAMPIGDDENGFMALLNDFTSPSGLLAAATELDLWFDTGAIRSEFSSWGDKWREVGKSDNPWDFAGNLIDALTGPIDDVVFPILNIGLLFTGVGAVANGARVGWNSARLVRSGGLFSRLYGGAGLARNLDEIGRASMLANRLLKSDTALRYAGRGMEAWRAWTPTRAAKSVVQQGMRLGFAQEAESRFGGYQGDGFSLNEIEPFDEAGQFLEQAKMAPAALPFEVLLAPYNIFTPGSFLRRGGEGLGLLSRAGSGTFRALGTAPGRAAAGAAVGVAAGTVAGEDAGDIGEGALLGAAGGAALPAAGRLLSHAPVASAVKGAIVGAVAGQWLGDGPEDAALGALAGAGLFAGTDTVRAKMFDQLGLSNWNKRLMGLGQAMSRTSFVPLADDQRISGAFDQGMQWALRDDPERLAKWTSDVQQGGVRRALKTVQGGDDELAAATIGYVYTSAMIDFIATAQADVLADAAHWRGRYHTARNKIINQLRNYDTTDLTEGTMNDIALSLAFTREGGTNLRDVYKRRDIILREMKASPEKALEWANKQNETAAETVRQLVSPKNLPKLDTAAGFDALPTDQDVALRLGERFGGQDVEARGWILQKYMQQITDTFGDYPKFASATAQIRDGRLQGLFDGAKLKPWKSRQTGGLKSVYPSVAKHLPEEQAAINAALTDQLLKLDAHAIGNVKGASPLASPHNPASVTVGRIGQKWKGDLMELADEIRDLRNVKNYLKRVRNPGPFRKGVARALGVDESTKLTDLTAKQIEAIFDPASGFDLNLSSKQATEYVVKYAQRNGLSLGELDQAVTQAADELAADAKRWAEYGFAEDAVLEGKSLRGWEALDARLKELKAEIPYRAAEIDADDLVRYLRESGNEAGAEQIRLLAEGAQGDGYTLVHGVEFLMPEDLIHGPIFEDVTRRHLNAASIGNAFRGKLPVERLLLEDRRQRQALVNALRGIKELHPEDDETSRILRALNDFLHEQQEPLNSALRNYHLETTAERLTTRLKSISSPVRLDDLARKKDKLIPYLREKLDIDDKTATAIWDATHKFRSTDWQEVGAYALEAKLRSTNVLEWGLKTLTGSKYGSGLKAKAGGVVPAAVAGATYGAVQTMDKEGLSFEDRLAAAATGAAMGAGGLAAARVGSNVLQFNKLADRAAHWRYGYLPDYLAQIRDSLRFTLSPMFDLSRYTEGLFLAQTAAPLRDANGKRISLPMNLTPHGLRKALRNEGMSKEAAMDQYQKWVGEFSHFGRTHGDFDAEILDSTGRWFKQLGILGFSPVDWMGTAFAQLKRQGMSSEQAYEAARQMYTYGTRGRSAAEMTANFIFFPFSFQKKALGHMAKWMNDDLSRSIIIHDALQTYQLLDEKYNLDERWRDHLPFLQQLNRLNLFAFGLSPGRFGGMNSQLFESMGKLGWNAFVPVGLDIKDATASQELQDVMKNLTPVLNDIEWMSKNIQETREVVDGMWDGTYLSRAAEIRKGYDEWSTFKQGFEAELGRSGYSMADVMRKPWLGELRALYEGTRAQLADKYPQWFEFRSENLGDIATLQMERQLRLDRAQQALRDGRAPKPDDLMVAQMEDKLRELKDQMELLTGSRDLLNAPEEALQALREWAAQQVRVNPSFRRLYDQFFLQELGPLSFTLEL